MAHPESLPDRATELLVVSIVMLILSTFFTVWRLIVRCKDSFWMGPSDWLMVVGAILCNVGMAITIVCSFYGAGRMLDDPYWKTDSVEKMVYQNHLAYSSQLFNMYGIWIVKLSICAYLLILDFSKGYKRVVWGTVIFVTIFNFILPATQHFALCRPLAARWDIRIKDKKCWPQMVRIYIGSAQAVSNIVSDLVYATAPIVYLRSVQLSRRTQWSVRAVFLMSLLCTIISSIKLWDYQRVHGLKEVYYESATMTIWSITEVAVGIVVANLPPLRKSFDGMFRHIMPTISLSKSFSRSEVNDKKQADPYLPTYRMSKVQRAGREPTEDNESDRAILASHSTISKTTDIVIDQQPKGDDWKC